MNPLRKTLTAAPVLVATLFLACPQLLACTGITLKAKDGAVVFARTLEWGSFDLKSRVVIVPRGHEYKSHLEDGLSGKSWKTVYGTVGVDAVRLPEEHDHVVATFIKTGELPAQ